HSNSQPQGSRGEVATQTPPRSTGNDPSVARPDEADKTDKQSPASSAGNSSFITTCFIPSLGHREAHASEGLRYRRGSQHPEAPPASYLQQQQQQHQQQHYGDPLSGRLFNTSQKSEALFHVPQDPLSRSSGPYPLHPPESYRPPYEPPSGMPLHPSGGFPYPHPHQHNHHHNPYYSYSDYGDSESGFYPRRHSSQSRSYRAAMSESEWSGYPDPEYLSHGYFSDYNYHHTPPQLRRSFQRRRSMDYPGYPVDYVDYPPDGYAAEDGRNNPGRRSFPPRKYRSQLELFTTGTGRVASGPGTAPKRSQSEDGAEEENLGTGLGRNQMPLSEELAAATGDSGPLHKTELELDLGASSKDLSASSSDQKTPVKNPVSPVPAKDEGGNSKLRQSLVSSIFIPTSPSLTLTPATPAATATEGGHMFRVTPVTRQSGHMIGQNLPALAGNLRSLPQGKHSTPLDPQPKHQTTVTVSSPSGSSGSLPTPVTSTVSVPSRSGSPKVFSSSFSASASASAFRSRQPRSCDILDDDDDIQFSSSIHAPTSASNTNNNNNNNNNMGCGSDPPASSASFVSSVYYESKGRSSSARSDGPVLNVAATSPFTSSRQSSQHSGSAPGSPSLRHRQSCLPSPARSRRFPPAHGYPPFLPHHHHHHHHQHHPHHRSYSSSSSSLPPMPYSGYPPPLSFSRGSEDMDGYFSSSMAESSSDLSFHSTPECGGRAGILNSRKLARLINQTVYFKGHRRPGCNYRPRRLFKEWAMLSKRKRLQEENRLLQHTLGKYKTELGVMEVALKVDFETALPEMTQEERDQVAHVEWLLSEVKGEVAETERLLLSRIKSVQSGNDFHSLLASMGVINKITELLKEQIYQQQVVSSRGAEADDEEDNDSFNNHHHNNDGDDRAELDDTPDDLEMMDEEFEAHSDAFWEGRNRSFHGFPHHPHPSRSWMAGVGPVSTPRSRSQGGPVLGMRDHFRSTSSTSNLPEDLNVSLEQMKNSLLSQVKQEIKDSTRKLELDLQAKDKEIQELKNQIGSRSAQSTPDLTHRTVFWTSMRDWSSRPGTPQTGAGGPGPAPLKRSRSRSRMMGDRIVQETDV
ncbi:hypothetical protein EGW08_001073, partial [Elysia chlorotica]